MKKNIQDTTGANATVRFTSGFLSPTASYNRINDAIAAVMNSSRAHQDKVSGAGAREVIVDPGEVAYRGQAP